MKKTITFCLLLSALCLLTIAARPRPCRTRAECFNRLLPFVTATGTPILAQTSTVLAVMKEADTPEPLCQPAWIDPYGVRHCGPFAPEPLCLPAWTDAYGVQHCGPIPPDFTPPTSAYPPPVTAPPAGYP